MDPFAKKMVQGSFLYLGVMLVMFTTLTVVYLHVHPRCSEQVISETGSPDSRWKAAILERRCSEEGPIYVHINLRTAAHPLRYDFFFGKVVDGEIFEIDQDAGSLGLRLRWLSPTELAIQCARCSAASITRREDRWENVRITYDLR